MSGYNQAISSGAKIYKWTKAGGLQALGPPDGTYQDNSNKNQVRACSSSGNACVGRFQPTSGAVRAFAWTESAGFIDAGSTYTQSEMKDVSADGSICVGDYLNGGVYYAGVFDIPTQTWTQIGRTVDELYISDDGVTVAGVNSTGVFRWTAEGGVVQTGASFTLLGMSWNGEVLIGYEGSRACKWDSVNGLVYLDVPGQTLYNAYASGVSANGSVVVGTQTTAAPAYKGIAWKWTAAGGVEAIAPTNDAFDYKAHHITSDGLSIAGEAFGNGLEPTVLGGSDVLPRFRGLVDLEGDFFDFTQSTV
jgi:uncharacterized membrane protein